MTLQNKEEGSSRSGNHLEFASKNINFFILKIIFNLISKNMDFYINVLIKIFIHSVVIKM